MQHDQYVIVQRVRENTENHNFRSTYFKKIIFVRKLVGVT